KTILEVFLDQRADPLGVHVVSVLVAGREHVGPDHHAPAHLRAEAGGTGALVQLDDLVTRHAQAVAHAVVAGEVRGRLGRVHNVIRGRRFFRVRQRLFDLLGARLGQPRSAFLPQRLDFRRHAIEPVFLGNADAHAIDGTPDRGGIVGYGTIRGGRVLRVVA